MWAGEAHYSPKLWDSMEAQLTFLEGNLDGTRKSVSRWCGMPGGYYVGEMSRLRWWLPKVGSEEEIEFWRCDCGGRDEEYRGEQLRLCNAIEHAPPTDDTRCVSDGAGKPSEDLKRWIVEADIIDERKREQWIQQVWMVMELCAGVEYVICRCKGSK